MEGFAMSYDGSALGIFKGVWNWMSTCVGI